MREASHRSKPSVAAARAALVLRGPRSVPGSPVAHGPVPFGEGWPGQRVVPILSAFDGRVRIQVDFQDEP